jgi:hypothetical protein
VSPPSACRTAVLGSGYDNIPSSPGSYSVVSVATAGRRSRRYPLVEAGQSFTAVALWFWRCRRCRSHRTTASIAAWLAFCCILCLCRGDVALATHRYRYPRAAQPHRYTEFLRSVSSSSARRPSLAPTTERFPPSWDWVLFGICLLRRFAHQAEMGFSDGRWPASRPAQRNISDRPS